MKCPICGKFMRFEKTCDFTDYYRCSDDCSRAFIADVDSIESNMEYADKMNKISKIFNKPTGVENARTK